MNNGPFLAQTVLLVVALGWGVYLSMTSRDETLPLISGLLMAGAGVYGLSLASAGRPGLESPVVLVLILASIGIRRVADEHRTSAS